MRKEEHALIRKEADCCYNCIQARCIPWSSWSKCQLLIDLRVEDTDVFWHEICDNFEPRPEGENQPLYENN